MKLIRAIFSGIIFIIGFALAILGAVTSLPGKVIQFIGLVLVGFAAGILVGFDMKKYQTLFDALNKISTK
jgi:ascorbate-specific PTS system EIIC-type component UlaA